MIAIDDVNIGLRAGPNHSAMQLIPDSVAYQAGTNPAVLNSEHRHRPKSRHDVRLACKEGGNVPAVVHPSASKPQMPAMIFRLGSAPANAELGSLSCFARSQLQRRRPKLLGPSIPSLA